MPKGNPFEVQCPNCGSYNVHFFTLYISGLDVIFVTIVTVGLGLIVALPVYIACKIATANPNKKYTCENCGKEWMVAASTPTNSYVPNRNINAPRSNLLMGVLGIIIVGGGLIYFASSYRALSGSNPNQTLPPSNNGIAPSGTVPSAFVVKPGMTWRGTLRTCGNPPACGAELKILIIDSSGNFTGTWANDYSSSNGTNYTDVENVQGNITGNHISWTGTGRIKGDLILPDAHHEGDINSDGHIHNDSQSDSFGLDPV